MVDAKYTQYANDVISGKVIAGKHLKQACQRFLLWLQRDDIEFRPDRADKVVNFANHITHSNNRHLTIELQAWQLFIIYNVFGFYWRGTDERVIHNVYIEVARKNGKSTLISLLALYMMMADGEYQAEVDIVANSHKQAQILYGMAQNYCESIDPKGKYFKRFRDNIQFTKTKSVVQTLASDTKNLDGYNASCFIMDEVHEQPNDLLYNVFKTSQAARKNPLGILITTAGLSMDSFCYAFRQNVLEVVYGTKDDDSTAGFIFSLDDEDDYRDESVWTKANPNLGVSVNKAYLREQVLQAENNPSLASNIQTKNFNVWSQTFDVWLPEEYLLRASKPIAWDFFKGKTVYVGIDLASVSDLTAVTYLTTDEGKYYAKTQYYIPSTCLNHNYNQTKYKEWKAEKYITVCPGNVTDYDYILSDLLKHKQEGMNIENIGYDQWNSIQFAISATEAGLTMTPYSQTLGSFNRPTKEIERLLKMENFIIDDNPITRWCFANSALKKDYHDNCKPVKAYTDNCKIDGVISNIEALGIYLQSPHYTAMV